MATIHKFPGPTARANVHTCIQLYAAGTISRQRMMTGVAWLLTDYGVTSLPVSNYRVHLGPVQETPAGRFPTVYIEAPTTEADRCPNCGEQGRYVTGEAGVLCGCGRMYRVKSASEGVK